MTFINNRDQVTMPRRATDSADQVRAWTGVRRMRVALWSGSSLNNVGDRLLAMVTELELARRLPDTGFEHFCPWSRTSNPKPLWVSESGDWPGSRMFNAVVVAGGGVFSGPPFRHSLMQVFCLGPNPSLFDS